jgi:FlaA1/EpsC-like NDP-sugar epimerase
LNSENPDQSSQDRAGGRSWFFAEEGPVVRAIRRYRLGFFFLLCSLVSLFSFYVSFLMRFEFSTLGPNGQPWLQWFLYSLPLVAFIRTGFFMVFGLHRVTWRFASSVDAVRLWFAVVAGSLTLAPSLFYIWDGNFPRSIFLIEGIVVYLIMGAARFSFRIVEDLQAGLGASRRTRVIVVGGGAAGNLVIRAMLTKGLVDYHPVAILDDDPLKQGTTLQGVPVVGPISDVTRQARRHGAEAIVMALPTASTSQFYRAVRECKRTGLPLKTTPDLAQILESSRVATRVSDFRLEDLLNRRPIRSDIPEIQELLFQKAVMVTGAAGSIGSELCRQIAGQGTRLLICVDKDENGLFRLEHELQGLLGDTEARYILGDIKDEVRMADTFGTLRPEIVFHAAAYKHVPILQHHPVEAVRNNVGGTRTIAELADRFGADRFVLISTDKAVNPTSVMGATKRIAERVVRTLNQRSETRFSIIRFGNVLGSAGSVVELFLKQIRAGQPVTVTHPEMERFFMTIPEAVHLVLQAASMGAGGETFILDMGKQVKIAQLARQMIRLSGLTPEVDVPIKYTGLRPGEKLYEELWTDQEKPQGTNNPGILQAPGEDALTEQLAAKVDALLAAAWDNDLEESWRHLLELVPTFQGQTKGQAALPPEPGAQSQPAEEHKA